MDSHPLSTSPPPPSGSDDAPEVASQADASPDATHGGAETHSAGAPPRPAVDPSTPRRTLSQLGDYLLLKKIGSGAMGAVYKAREISTQRQVALKVLFKHVAASSKLLERFNREARVAGLLDHPNIVRGFGVDEDHGWHYFAMEFIEGDSLQKWLRRLGKLSLGDSLHITLACARALEYAHKEALVHRDVKPDNIMITSKGETKLADLGMVKQLDADMSLTQTGHAVGTPWYMPLEQAKNAKETDGRCDIYALGCVLYACLTGAPPFTGKTLVDVIQAKEVGTFSPARQSNREVPERVDLLIAKMAAKQPKYRYQNCTELIKDLESIGLANPTLTFLNPTEQGSDPAVNQATAVLPIMQTPISGDLQSPETDTWYIRYKQADGTPTQEKLSTSEVLSLADAPDFDPTAKASRHPKEGFRALATIKEFERLAGKLARSHADKQTFRQRKLYDKIVEEQTALEDQENAPLTTGQYWFGIFWRCALAGGVIGVLLYLVGSYFASGMKGIFW